MNEVVDNEFSITTKLDLNNIEDDLYKKLNIDQEELEYAQIIKKKIWQNGSDKNDQTPRNKRHASLHVFFGIFE